MAYIGTSPTQAVRTRFLYTATASQTTFSGADTQNLTLRYSDANFVDVYQNGVLLKGGGADYTATTTTSVVLATGATADDVIEIIVYDVFAVANLIKKDGDTVEGVINFNGKEITLDADFDTSITADTDDEIHIKIAGADDFKFKANTLEVQTGSNIDMNGTELILDADADTSITADTDDQIDVKVAGTDQITIKDGAVSPVTNNDVDLGTSSLGYKDIYAVGQLKFANFEIGDQTIDGNTVVFRKADETETMRINSSSNVGIGTTSPPDFGSGFTSLQVNGSSSGVVQANNSTNSVTTEIEAEGTRGAVGTRTNHDFVLKTNQTERMRITSSEVVINDNSNDLDFRVETNAVGSAFFVDAGTDVINFFSNAEVNTGSNAGTGVTIKNNGRVIVQTDDGVNSNDPALRLGRLNHDAGDTILLFSTNGDARGSITESSGTVSYNAFMGSHITQAVPSDTLEGTVLETTGELIDSTDEDYKGYIEQKRLTKCKVSDTEDTNNVYGVFQIESKSGLQYASALGSFFVRVHKDETVALGDLLSSKGDGTAKVQSDDIIRSRTIGKVTSLTKKTTHSDGSYLLPCVLYCG